MCEGQKKLKKLELARSRYHADLEKSRAQNRAKRKAYYYANIEQERAKARARSVAYYYANRAKVSARAKARYQANPDPAKARAKGWAKANADAVRRNARGRSARLTAGYVRHQLLNRPGWKGVKVPAEVIEIKRKHLELIRELRKAKQNENHE
jgi:chorismate synthase